MRKSSNLSRHYRPGTSRGHLSAVTFRDQMTDYARGDVLRELRAATGKSREKVAGEIDVTTKTLFSWEMRNGAIKPENLKRLAEFYNRPATDLASRDPEVDTPPTRDQLDRIEAKLDGILRLLRRIATAGVPMPEADLARALEGSSPTVPTAQPEESPAAADAQRHTA